MLQELLKPLNDSPYNEKLILQQVAQGSHAAFASLFQTYKDRVYHAASLYTKDPAVAKEMVQEVFLKVWLNRHKLPGINDFRSWLFILARNQVIKFMEKWANNKALEWNWAQSGVEDDAVQQHDMFMRLIQEAVAHLPARQQVVFKMAKDEQLSYEAIAQRLQISPLTVKTHMQRALQNIRDWLQQHGELSALLFLLFL